MNRSKPKVIQVTHPHDNVKVKQDLVAAVNSVRSKFKALKRGEDVTSRELERTFQPVVDPLQKLLTKIKTEDEDDFRSQFKVEKNSRRSRLSQFLESPSPARKKYSSSTPKESPFQSYFENINTPKPSQALVRSPEYFETPRPTSSLFRSPEESFSSLHEDTLKTTKLSRPATSKAILSTKKGGPLSKQYIEGMIRDTSREYDHKFGVYENPVSGMLMLGREPIDFGPNDTIYLGGTPTTGTVGLFELLFKQNPREDFIKEQDKKTWKTLLSRSYAHKQKYDPQLNLASSTNRKYMDFIKPLFKPGSTSSSPQSEFIRKTRTSSVSALGKGIIRLSKNKVDYVHWDNPNELVERLRLLVASQQAGHQGHDLEINSIEEELREAGIIY